MTGVNSSQRGSFPWEAVCGAMVLVIAVVGFVLANKDTLLMPFLSDDYMFVAMTHPPGAYKVLRSLIPERCDIIYYRPLSFLSFSIDSLVWGTSAFGFHLTNLLLHVTNAFLVYLLAFRLIRNRSGAVTAAAFFLVFPLQHEVVIWICGRFDSLSTLFYLLCALSYFEFRTGGRRRYLYGALLCGILSLLSKETGVTFPVLLLGMELILFHDEPLAGRKRLLFCLCGLLLILPFYVGFRWLALRDAIHLYMASMPSPPTTVSTARLLLTSLLGVVAGVFYYPWRPIAFPYNPLVQTSAWHFWVSQSYHASCLLLVLVGIATGAFRNRATFFCIALFFISLLPSGVMLPSIEPANLQNTRVLYLSIAFLSVLLGNLAFGGRETRFPILRPLARFSIVIALAVVLSIGLYRNHIPWLDASRLSEAILSRFKAHALRMDHPGVIYVEGVPISHDGIYIFGTGFMEAVNLSMGTLPDYPMEPGKRKLSSYVDYLLNRCPWKPMFPNFQAQAILNAQLACQGYSFPDWYSENPGDYAHVIRWNPEAEKFEVIR